MSSRFPEVPLALLERLEQAFPDRMPDPTLPPAVIGTLAGEVNVVRLLRRHFNDQTKTVLEKK